MIKPDQLRRVLLAHVPDLKDNPDRLSLFIDKGTIAARPGNLSFEYAYTLNVVVQDYSGAVDALVVPIVAWIAEAQPDLLERAPQQPFTFESEILDGNAADVSIYIQLTEGVLVTPREGGGFDAQHLEEPGAGDDFADACCRPLWQIFLKNQLVAETSDPEFDPHA